jgi:hypothetical protein
MIANDLRFVLLANRTVLALLLLGPQAILLSRPMVVGPVLSLGSGMTFRAKTDGR